MTPNDIDVLLHHHVSPNEHPRADAPAVKQAIAEFIDRGILAMGTSGSLVTTERGRKLVEMLCETPYPVMQYVDPREKKP